MFLNLKEKAIFRNKYFLFFTFLGFQNFQKVYKQVNLVILVDSVVYHPLADLLSLGKSVQVQNCRNENLVSETVPC